MSVVEWKVTYKTVGDVELSLHVFRKKGVDEALPGAVFFFGGGWIQGSEVQFYPQCRHLAERGMVACCADYRVFNRHGVNPFECMEDARDALRFLRAHADELGLDATRLAAGGGSAGAHLAACAALISGRDGEAVTDEVKPQALLLLNPVLNPLSNGELAERFEGRALEASPLEHADAGTPPSLILVAQDDTVTPLVDQQAFRDKVQSLGGRCDLVVYPEGGHGFYLDQDRENSFHSQTLAEIDRFLVSLGWLASETD